MWIAGTETVPNKHFRLLSNDDQKNRKIIQQKVCIVPHVADLKWSCNSTCLWCATSCVQRISLMVNPSSERPVWTGSLQQYSYCCFVRKWGRTDERDELITLWKPHCCRMTVLGGLHASYAECLQFTRLSKNWSYWCLYLRLHSFENNFST